MGLEASLRDPVVRERADGLQTTRDSADRLRRDLTGLKSVPTSPEEIAISVCDRTGPWEERDEGRNRPSHDSKENHMSTDERTTTDLIETLRDGEKGFADAAEKLESTDRADLAPQFQKYALQRGTFAAELERMAARYGDDIDENGSAAAALHRGWMALKDALSGDSASGVLDAAEQGEDHAVSEYEKALAADISPELRTVVSRQFNEIKLAHDEVKALRNAVS